MGARDVADVLVRAGAVRTMEPDAGPTTALAIRDGAIAAVAGPDGERDLLRAWRGPGTAERTVAYPRMAVLPYGFH